MEDGFLFKQTIIDLNVNLLIKLPGREINLQIFHPYIFFFFLISIHWSIFDFLIQHLVKTILLGKFTVVYKQSLYVSIKSESYIPEWEIKLFLIWYISIYKCFQKFGVTLNQYYLARCARKFKEYKRTNVYYIIKCCEKLGQIIKIQK